MEARRKQQRKHSFWPWAIATVTIAMVVLISFASQAYAAGITVISGTINDGTTVYPTVYEADWVTGGNLKTWTLTPNLTAGTVTTVSVSGAKSGGGTRPLTVQLLDGAATVISTGCFVVPTGNPFSVTVDVVPDVTFSSVARVKALQVSAC